MSSEVVIFESSVPRTSALESDERWQLVQRIVLSERFQRAEQLKKMLLYIAEAGILHPETVLHEYEIACNALSRRNDFNPANDNIVRAQFINLRRKLEQYFSEEEGRQERLLLTIPKGSYSPVFQPVVQSIDEPRAFSSAVHTTGKCPQPAAYHPAGSDSSQRASSDLPHTPLRSRWKRVGMWLTMVGVAEALVLGALLISRLHGAGGTGDPRASDYNPAFLQLLSQMGRSFSVVLPDTSEMMIHLVTRQDILANDYVAKDYPRRQIETLSDPEERKLLYQLALRRNTTETESQLAFGFMDAIRSVNHSARLQYARDIRVRDFNEGNTILIGSQDSNPWVTLFVDRTNFQLKQAPNGARYFENVKPLPGEQKEYIIDTPAGRGSNQYVSVAMVPNPTRSGFVLLITGSDTASVEGASQFLLHGKMPPEVDAMFHRKNLDYFELFFKSVHMEEQSENSFDLLSLRM